MSDIKGNTMDIAALQYARDIESSVPYTVKSHFCAGAEWQKERDKELIGLMRQLLVAYDIRYPDAQQLLVGHTNCEIFQKIDAFIDEPINQ